MLTVDIIFVFCCRCECRWRDKLHPKLLLLEKELRDQIIQQDDYAHSAINTGVTLSVNNVVDNSVIVGSSNASLTPQKRYTSEEDEMLKSLVSKLVRVMFVVF